MLCLLYSYGVKEELALVEDLSHSICSQEVHQGGDICWHRSADF